MTRKPADSKRDLSNESEILEDEASLRGEALAAGQNNNQKSRSLVEGTSADHLNNDPLTAAI